MLNKGNTPREEIAQPRNSSSVGHIAETLFWLA